MRVKDSVEKTHDVILSKFFYSLEVPSATTAIISIHQENKSNMGADRRPNIDMNFVILNREDDGDLNLIDYVDYSIQKSISKEIHLEAGNYIIVPGSLGGYLQRPKQIPDNITKPEYLVQEIKDFGRVVHPVYRSIIKDIFKKIDISMERIVEPDELDLFGSITGLSIFNDIDDTDFGANGSLRKYSSTPEGFTCLGFQEFISTNVSDEEF